MDISLHSEVISKFRQWYDAVWLGDEEHGQTIPQSFSDARYVEYMDGYTLALGAWVESARQTANLNLLAVVPETLVVVPDGYALMPIEPTTGICKAAADGWLDCGSKMVLNKAGAAYRSSVAYFMKKGTQS